MENKKRGETLWLIFDAIIDSAAEESFDQNVATIQSIDDYAYNGMDLIISKLEAQFIRVMLVHHAFLCANNLMSQNIFYHQFEKFFDEL